MSMKTLSFTLLTASSLLLSACQPQTPAAYEHEPPTSYAHNHTYTESPDPVISENTEVHNLSQEGIELAKDFIQDLWRLFSPNVGWRNHAMGELYVQIARTPDATGFEWSRSNTNFEPTTPINQRPEGTEIPLFFTDAHAREHFANAWLEVDTTTFSRNHLHHEWQPLTGFYDSNGERLTPPLLTSGILSEFAREGGAWTNGWTTLDATAVSLFDFQENGIPDILVTFGGWFNNFSHVNGVGGNYDAEKVLFSYIDGAFRPVLYVSDFMTDFWRDTAGNVLVRQDVNLYSGNPSHHVPPGFHLINWNESEVRVTPVVEVEYWLDWENYINWSNHFWDNELGVDIFSAHPTLPGTGEPIAQIQPLTELTQRIIAEISIEN